jgi:uncharacterized membrane protein
MSDVISPAPAPRPIESDQRLVAALVYGLFLFGIFTHGLTMIIGVIVAYVKRADTRGTVFESHYSNAITVFWASAIVWGLLIAAVIAGVIGTFGFFAPHIWYWDHGWHWHAHEWASQMHQWRDQLQDHTVPQEWWPWIGLAPLIGLGFLAFGIWYLYRVLRGLVHALENRPY